MASGNDAFFLETAATSVVLKLKGRNADGVADDTITITCGAGDELAIADKLMGMVHNPLSPAVIEVGADFYNASITTIAYAAV